MNLLPTPAYSNVPYTGISLRQVINRLLSDALPSVAPNKNVIVNEVTPDIRMIADQDKVVPVISELLTSVVNNARNGNIHISAERFRDGLIIEIQERNNYNGYALAYRVQSIEPQATMLGGYITMKGQQQLVTTISFGFPNQKERN